MHKFTEKTFSLLVILALLATSVPIASASNTYELWTESPYVTSGLTISNIDVIRGMSIGELDLYHLSEVGPNVWLASTEKKMTNGGQGSAKTSYLYFYVLLTNGNDFIILSESYAGEQFYWDRGLGVMDLEGHLDSQWYTSKGYDVPAYLMTPYGMYSATSAGYGRNTEYYIVTKSGKIGKFNIYYSGSDQLIIHNGVLSAREDYYYRSSSGSYVRWNDGKVYTRICPLLVDGNAVKKDENNVSTFYLQGTSYTFEEPHTPISSLTNNVNASNYYKLSDPNLFFIASRQQRFDEAANRTYYDIVVETYVHEDYKTKLKDKKVFQTKDTSATAIEIFDLGSVDRQYYLSKNSPVPQYALYNNKIIVNEDGSSYLVDPVQIDSALYVTWDVALYNNRIVVIRPRDGSKTVYEKNPENNKDCYWQMLNYTYSNNGVFELDVDVKLPISTTANAGQNGFYKSTSSFTKPTLTASTFADKQDWWLVPKNNVFPDGRKVTLFWSGMGGGIYEIWYRIYNSDGTVRAVGPTGQGTSYSSSFNMQPLAAIAINNSKFIGYINEIGHSFIREQYRIAVAEESGDGEVVAPGGGSNMGTKNITIPQGADTVPIYPQIDFGESDLPLGYNISPNLKNDIASIIIPDIVIVKKPGYISGVINTGQSIDNEYVSDNGLGSTIYFSGNGSNLVWSCNYPNNLTVGTHNKSILLNGKTLYLRIKVINTPANGGNTTVVF